MKKYLIALSIISVVVIGFFMQADPLGANALYRSPNSNARTSTATSSPTFLTAGGSTFVTYNAYDNPTGISTLPERTAFLIAHTASTTASVLQLNFEYSADGIDWYTDAMNGVYRGTTTQAIGISATSTYTMVGTTVASTTRKAILIENPTQFVRVKLTSSTGNGAVWGEFVPTKQR